jgi:hypothetical protein
MKFKNYLLFSLLSFSLLLHAQNQKTIINITGKVTTVTSYTDKEIVISGKSDLRITAQSCATALNNSIIRLKSDDSWVIFENLRPSEVLDSLLKYIYVNEELAVNKNNVRVAIYAHGTVVMPHTPQHRPLAFYTEKNFQGQLSTFPLYTYHNTLGAMDNTMRSFKLKRGYMATLATNADGSGYSRVFIADNEDIEFAELDYLLDETVSFVRVFPWEYVTKKGWCGAGARGVTEVELIKGTWWYSWSADQESRINQSYVPIKQNQHWPGWSVINNKTVVNHLLGFNEPDRPDQANMTVAQALAAWPEYMRSGLRLGTPATASPNAWLYEFVDSCKARNWRVDYVAVHAYWGNKSPQNWYNDLRNLHRRTGLPIWITEWNNGANWTTESWPTPNKSLSPANAAKQLNDLKAILNVLDTASFIERYSIYNWVQDARAMILSGDYRVTVNPTTGQNDTVFLENGLTPAGVHYKNNKSRMAFDRRYEVIPTWKLSRNPTITLSYTATNATVTINDGNGEFYRGFVLEKKVGNEPFEVIVDSNNRTLKSYTEPINTSFGAINYRVRAKLADGTLSNYSSVVGMDVTQGDSIVQYGSINVSGTDWNSVFFSQSFGDIPAIVTGAPSNNNINALFTPRIRFVNRTSRFQVQASAWQYQNIRDFGQHDMIPYFAMMPGEHDFGGIKALSARTTATANWTTVSFPTPFEEAPVVFVNQLIAMTSYPTVVRIRNVTTTGFEVKIFKEEGVTTVPGTETITYIALTPGTGVINNRKVIVGRTAENFVTTTARQILYGDTFQTPLFISQMQTCNDEVTAALRLYYLFDRGAFVFKQRERSQGGSATTATEGAGWLVIDQTGIVQNLPHLKNNLVEISPNPVRDILRINQTPTGEKIQIFNLSGVLVKTLLFTNNEIDVKDLPSGYYFIRGTTIRTSNFIKM